MELRDAIAVVMFLIQAVMALWLRSINTRQQEIGELKADIKAEARDHVRTQMELEVAKLGTPIERLATQLEAVNARLAKGDGQFDRLSARDHQVEVAMLQAIQQVREQMATRDDLSKLNGRIDGMQQVIAKGFEQRRIGA